MTLPVVDVIFSCLDNADDSIVSRLVDRIWLILSDVDRFCWKIDCEARIDISLIGLVLMLDIAKLSLLV